MSYKNTCRETGRCFSFKVGIDPSRVLRGTESTPVFDVWSIPEGELLFRAELDLELLPEEFLTFYINPWCRDFIAVHEDEGMVQRILLRCGLAVAHSSW